jgi:hypothetical protein
MLVATSNYSTVKDYNSNGSKPKRQLEEKMKSCMLEYRRSTLKYYRLRH